VKLECINFRRVSDPKWAFLLAFRVIGIAEAWYMVYPGSECEMFGNT